MLIATAALMLRSAANGYHVSIASLLTRLPIQITLMMKTNTPRKTNTSARTTATVEATRINLIARTRLTVTAVPTAANTARDHGDRDFDGASKPMRDRPLAALEVSGVNGGCLNILWSWSREVVRIGGVRNRWVVLCVIYTCTNVLLGIGICVQLSTRCFGVRIGNDDTVQARCWPRTTGLELFLSFVLSFFIFSDIFYLVFMIFIPFVHCLELGLGSRTYTTEAYMTLVLVEMGVGVLWAFEVDDDGIQHIVCGAYDSGEMDTWKNVSGVGFLDGITNRLCAAHSWFGQIL